MPFGKHKGEPLQDVPARYLLWLWRDGLNEYSGVKDHDRLAPKIRLANYIWNSQSVIAQETGETL